MDVSPDWSSLTFEYYSIAISLPEACPHQRCYVCNLNFNLHNRFSFIGTQLDVRVQAQFFLEKIQFWVRQIQT